MYVCVFVLSLSLSASPSFSSHVAPFPPPLFSFSLLLFFEVTGLTLFELDISPVTFLPETSLTPLSGAFKTRVVFLEVIFLLYFLKTFLKFPEELHVVLKHN